jgi:hypothetical protein
VSVAVLMVMLVAEAAYKIHSLSIHPSAFSGNTQWTVNNYIFHILLHITGNSQL